MTMLHALANVPSVDRGPWVTRFGDDPHSWNLHEDEDAQDGEGSGLPGEAVIRDALQTFAACWGGFDAPTAARVFNLPQALVDEVLMEARRVPYSEVGRDELGELVATLTHCRGVEPSVAEMARLVNCHRVQVVEAVGSQRFLYLSGPQDDFTKLMIGVDGE